MVNDVLSNNTRFKVTVQRFVNFCINSTYRLNLEVL